VVGQQHGAAPTVLHGLQATRQACGNRQSHAQAFALVALRVAWLQKLFKHLRMFIGRNANAGVPDLQSQRIGALPYAHQHTAARGVAQGVAIQRATSGQCPNNFTPS